MYRLEDLMGAPYMNWHPLIALHCCCSFTRALFRRITGTTAGTWSETARGEITLPCKQRQTCMVWRSTFWRHTLGVASLVSPLRRRGQNDACMSPSGLKFITTVCIQGGIPRWRTSCWVVNPYLSCFIPTTWLNGRPPLQLTVISIIIFVMCRIHEYPKWISNDIMMIRRNEGVARYTQWRVQYLLVGFKTNGTMVNVTITLHVNMQQNYDWQDLY